MITAVLYMFAGWLADVYFGRYKVMKGSIWVMWWGSVGGTLLLVIHSPLTSTQCTSVVVVYACGTIGSTGLIVNAVPLGTDQLLGTPSEEISSFAHALATWAF